MKNSLSPTSLVARSPAIIGALTPYFSTPPRQGYVFSRHVDDPHFGR